MALGDVAAPPADPSAAAPKGGSARAVARNLSWLVAGEVLIKLSLLAAALAVARGLGPAGLGTFTLAYGAALILVVVFSLGQVETLIRETAARPAAARQLLAAALRLENRLLLPLLPLLALSLIFFTDPALAWAAASFLAYGVLRARLITLAAPFKGLDRMDVEIKARGLETALAVPFTVVAAFAGWPVWTLGLAFAVGAGAGLAWLTARLDQLPGEGSEPPPGFLLAEGWPFLALGLLFHLLYRGDVFLLEALAAGRTAVGHYGAAGTLVWGTITLAQLSAMALYPTLSRSANRGRLPARPALALCAAGAVSGAALAALLGAAAGSLVRLAFGAGYEPVVELLSILAWALPGASAAMLLGIVLAAWRRQRLGLLLQGLAVLAALGADLALIPSLGALGAARVAVGVHSALALAQLGVLLGIKGR